jgi:hypothetical protein
MNGFEPPLRTAQKEEARDGYSRESTAVPVVAREWTPSKINKMNKISPRAAPSPIHSRNNSVHDDVVVAAIRRETNVILEAVQAGVSRLETHRPKFWSNKIFL